MKILGTLVLFALSSVAFADVTVTYSNTGPLDDGNVLFNGTGTSTTDPPIGRVGTQLFQFDSVGDTLKASAAGQAKVEATDDTFQDLSFYSTTGQVFTSAILNLTVNRQGQPGNIPDGQVIFTFEMLNEAPIIYAPLELDANGNNFYTITAAAPEKILRVTLATTLALDDVKQVRIGGIQPEIPGEDPTVPEPMTMTLFGSGLGLLIAARARKSRRK
ncbi:MAG TPA: hypothetical protein VER03_09730 [Bryobacteraceae bacterium]|nr:hypothetical protein [Bryobacteraceae bacterium]